MEAKQSTEDFLRISMGSVNSKSHMLIERAKQKQLPKSHSGQKGERVFYKLLDLLYKCLWNVSESSKSSKHFCNLLQFKIQFEWVNCNRSIDL